MNYYTTTLNLLTSEGVAFVYAADDDSIIRVNLEHPVNTGRVVVPLRTLTCNPHIEPKDWREDLVGRAHDFILAAMKAQWHELLSACLEAYREVEGSDPAALVLVDLGVKVESPNKCEYQATQQVGVAAFSAIPHELQGQTATQSLSMPKVFDTMRLI